MARNELIRLEQLFNQAVELDPAARDEWLAALAVDDAGLAASLARLLAADAAQADELAAVPTAPAASTGDPIAERIERQVALGAGRLEPGDRVGAWTVGSILGRGGMGTVYLARRSDKSYRQQAVIKVVEAAGHARLSRLFERERQILADLNHPGIARLLDGGELDDGRPYLVMEHVDGADIASHCEQQRLNLQARLRLLIDLAQAVQFAHANRVIHRDLKPDNVMVDARGQVRLLDFGIAQLLERPEQATAADASAAAVAPSLTLHEALLSPEYASPEQLRGETITTATDIYSLGLLLHRLLTGRLPDREAGPDLQPVHPTLGEKIRPSARDDLEAILATALAADPADRYPSADALAADLRRFLDQRPVSVRPIRWWQQAQLFARRNPALALSLSLSFAAVMGFSLGLLGLALALERERQRVAATGAITEQVAGFMVELFAAADPESALGEPISARELLDRGARRIAELDRDPSLQAMLGHRMAQAYRNLGVSDRADELMTAALDLAEHLTPRQRRDLALQQADLWRELGRGPAAAERLLALIPELESDADAGMELARAYNNYGLVLSATGYPVEAETWTRRALAVDLGNGPEARQQRVSFRHNLALQLGQQGRSAEAIELLEGVLQDKHELFGPLHPSHTRSLELLAIRYSDLGDMDRAVELLSQIRATHVQVIGADSLAVARLDNELAAVLQDAGDYRRSEYHYRLALTTTESRPEIDPMLRARVLNNLGTLLEDVGREAEALGYLRRSVALREQLLSPHEQAMIGARINLARVLIRTNDLDQAEHQLAELETQLAAHHAGHSRRAAQLRLLRAEWLAAAGQLEAAREQALASWATFGDESASQTALIAATSALRVARVLLAVGDTEAAAISLAFSEAKLADVTTTNHPIRLLLALYRAEYHLLRGETDLGWRLLDQLTEPMREQFGTQSSLLRHRALLAGRSPG